MLIVYLLIIVRPVSFEIRIKQVSSSAQHSQLGLGDRSRFEGQDTRDTRIERIEHAMGNDSTVLLHVECFMVFDNADRYSCVHGQHHREILRHALDLQFVVTREAKASIELWPTEDNTPRRCLIS